MYTSIFKGHSDDQLTAILDIMAKLHYEYSLCVLSYRSLPNTNRSFNALARLMDATDQNRQENAKAILRYAHPVSTVRNYRYKREARLIASLEPLYLARKAIWQDVEDARDVIMDLRPDDALKTSQLELELLDQLLINLMDQKGRRRPFAVTEPWLICDKRLSVANLLVGSKSASGHFINPLKANPLEVSSDILRASTESEGFSRYGVIFNLPCIYTNTLDVVMWSRLLFNDRDTLWFQPSDGYLEEDQILPRDMAW